MYVGFLHQQLIDFVDGPAIVKLQWWFGILGQLVLPRWAAESVRYAVWFVVFILCVWVFRIGGRSKFCAHTNPSQFYVFLSTCSFLRSIPVVFFVMFFLVTISLNWFL